MSAWLTGKPVKLQTLFRLGALATLLPALGYAIGEAMYLFGNMRMKVWLRPDKPEVHIAWRSRRSE
jgi:hypothetical protein